MNKFEIVEKIKFTSHAVVSNNYLIKITHNTEEWSYIQVIASPFANCQTFLISPFRNLFWCKDDYANVTNKVKELNRLCNINKYLCQVDIRASLFTNIEPHIKIYCKMDYTNLTGSKMVNLLIRI